MHVRRPLPIELHRELTIQTATLGIKDSTGTGSRFICPEHCTEKSDWDVLCLVDKLPQLGEPYCGASPEQAYFESIKYPKECGTLNLIVTADSVFYHRFVTATNIAKWLKMTVREDRVKLFQAILYHKNPNQ